MLFSPDLFVNKYVTEQDCQEISERSLKRLCQKDGNNYLYEYRKIAIMRMYGFIDDDFICRVFKDDEIACFEIGEMLKAASELYGFTFDETKYSYYGSFSKTHLDLKGLEQEFLIDVLDYKDRSKTIRINDDLYTVMLKCSTIKGLESKIDNSEPSSTKQDSGLDKNMILEKLAAKNEEHKNIKMKREFTIDLKTPMNSRIHQGDLILTVIDSVPSGYSTDEDVNLFFELMRESVKNRAEVDPTKFSEKTLKKYMSFQRCFESIPPDMIKRIQSNEKGYNNTDDNDAKLVIREEFESNNQFATSVFLVPTDAKHQIDKPYNVITYTNADNLSKNVDKIFDGPVVKVVEDITIGHPVHGSVHVKAGCLIQCSYQVNQDVTTTNTNSGVYTVEILGKEISVNMFNDTCMVRANA